MEYSSLTVIKVWVALQLARLNLVHYYSSAVLPILPEEVFRFKQYKGSKSHVSEREVQISKGVNGALWLDKTNHVA